MMPSEEVTQVYIYDGSTIWFDRVTPLFEVGNFLGSGAAGTVYECEHVKSKEHYALKVLSPLGYKINSPMSLRKFNILTRGKVYLDNSGGQSGRFSIDHVWWLVNGSKQYIPSYFSEKTNCLVELSLKQCIDVWGTNPKCISEIDDDNLTSFLVPTVLPSGQKVFVPKIPPKFLEFLRKRDRIFREIKNMRKICHHKNVIRLEYVLELVQETKFTIFLVMELANGGELFDRIKVDRGTLEDTAKFYFQQLLDGVKHCHDQGVCHRDLKPENLLLQDTSESGTILKIADFGFSARFAMGTDRSTSNSSSSTGSSSSLFDESPLTILKSVVGSPFYVAPEVLQARGYDGPKADIWSLGVILFAMLAGNLPFGQELNSCKRFKQFCKWMEQFPGNGLALWSDPNIEYPEWLFSSKFSVSVKGLIVSMLHPDPRRRISVDEAMTHPLCVHFSNEEESPVAISDEVLSVSSEKTDSLSLNEEVTMDMDMDMAEEQEELDNINGDDNAVIAVNIGIVAASSSDSCTDESMLIVTQDVITMACGDDMVASDGNNYDSSYCSSEGELDDEEEDEDEDDCVFAMEEDNTDDKAKKNPNYKNYPPKPLSSHVSQSHEPATPCFRAYNQNGQSDIPVKRSYSPIADSPYNRRGFDLASSPLGTRPPIAPLMFDSPVMVDLLPNSDDESESTTTTHGKSNTSPLPMQMNSGQPPSFNELVKRSTRFITAVPAAEVLLKVQTILEDCKTQRTHTFIGLIGRIDLNWTNFKLEIWGLEDIHAPPICALQLFQLSSDAARSFSLSPSTSSSSLAIPYTTSNTLPTLIEAMPNSLHSNSSASIVMHGGPPVPGLFLVEFVRGQIDIFAFKRFYDWLRQQLSVLVKRDYSAFNLFEPSISPKVDYQLLHGFQQRF